MYSIFWRSSKSPSNALIQSTISQTAKSSNYYSSLSPPLADCVPKWLMSFQTPLSRVTTFSWSTQRRDQSIFDIVQPSCWRVTSASFSLQLFLQYTLLTGLLVSVWRVQTILELYFWSYVKLGSTLLLHEVRYFDTVKECLSWLS